VPFGVALPQHVKEEASCPSRVFEILLKRRHRGEQAGAGKTSGRSLRAKYTHSVPGHVLGRLGLDDQQAAQLRSEFGQHQAGNISIVSRSWSNTIHIGSIQYTYYIQLDEQSFHTS